MNLSEIEIIEAAWRILDALPSCSARSAADHIVEFLQELDDDGVIDRLNGGRSGQDLIAGLKASFSMRHAR